MNRSTHGSIAPGPKPSPLRWLAVTLLLACLAGVVAYWLWNRPSNNYEQFVRNFYVGVAALDVGDKERAVRRLTEAAELIPTEPATWANLALANMQLGDVESARRELTEAERLAPESAEIQMLWSALENSQGRTSEAMARLERAATLAPDHARIQYALVEMLLRLNPEENRQRATQLVDRLLEQHPDNLLLLLQRAELATTAGDRTELERLLDERLQPRLSFWPEAGRQQHAALRQAMAGEDWQTKSLRELRFLQNVLKPTPDFKAAVTQVVTPAKLVSQPVYQFLRLEPPTFEPAPPDTGLSFDRGEAAGVLAGMSLLQAPAWGAQLEPQLVVADAAHVVQLDGELQLATMPGNSTDPPPAAQSPAAHLPSAHSVLFIDWNRDFRLGLVLAATGGLKLLRRSEDGALTDATTECGLDAETLTRPFVGAWALDVESDGDLDILAAPESGPPQLLRNNGDGTFQPLDLFGDVVNPRDCGWADLDDDGDPDVVLRDNAGRLHVFENRRSGRFVPALVPDDLPPVVALAIGDANSDGRLDLVLLSDQGELLRLSALLDFEAWEWLRVSSASAELQTRSDPGSANQLLWLADVDNNGALDCVASVRATPTKAVPNKADRGDCFTQVWLNHARDQFQPQASLPDLFATDVEDVTGDGRLDLLGVDKQGAPLLLTNRGTRDYHWQILRPRALQKAESSDSRLNSFALGAEIEVRGGLLVQKRPVEKPRVHFGLGTQPQIDVARIVWPYGGPQAEFELAADSEVTAEQRLIGSCPFLFAYDGREMVFVTDFLWRSPLGLRINAQDTAGVLQTEDWVKIRGDQLQPREGVYDLRITADLWETHFFDHMALLVVDHPEDVEIFVDERFSFPPPPLAVVATTPPQPIDLVWDQDGRDVADLVRHRDHAYLDTFVLGEFQGVTGEHWVELELPEDAPREGPLLLVAQGFVYPTDSSVNMALSQGRHPAPRGLTLEVADGDDNDGGDKHGGDKHGGDKPGEGGWRVIAEDLGFPSGKGKTVLLDLQNVFVAGAPRRLRLRTNLEVYWDQLRWAVRRDDVPLATRRLAPSRAELRFRGISQMFQANRRSPDLPVYARPATGAGRWRDLEGFYTRFGDVRELLQARDDRYVIVNSGDELRMEFDEVEPPDVGMSRDFVMLGDGWVKDGNLNTAFSRTVLPLPSHDDSDYATPPGELKDDPVYQRHSEDWRKYHTRYVWPADFQQGLRRAVESAGPTAPSTGSTGGSR